MFHKTIGKRFVSFLMTANITLLMVAFPISATDLELTENQVIEMSPYTVSPLWENVDTSRLTLTFSGKKIFSKIVLSGVKGTKYKDGTVTISKYSGGKYVPVGKWEGLSSSASSFVFSNSELDATSGVKYKLSIKITAYTSSNSEVVKANKVSTCP